MRKIKSVLLFTLILAVAAFSFAACGFVIPSRGSDSLSFCDACGECDCICGVSPEYSCPFCGGECDCICGQAVETNSCSVCGGCECDCDLPPPPVPPAPPHIPSVGDLDAELIARIKLDYKAHLSEFEDIEADADDISVTGYYGTYSGHYEGSLMALKLEVQGMDYLAVKHEFNIAGARFVYPDSNVILIYGPNYPANVTPVSFNRVRTALGYGSLTREEVQTIAALHEAENREFYENNRLDIALENQIKQDFYYANGMERNWSYGGVTYSYTYDDVYIVGFCGEYASGAVALMITGSGFCYTQATTTEDVDGVIFHYPDSFQMSVWHEGQFYKLSDYAYSHHEIIDGEYEFSEWRYVSGAYTLGLLTYEELLVTQALYNAGAPHW